MLWLTKRYVLDSVLGGTYDVLASELPEGQRKWTDPLVQQFQRDCENLYMDALSVVEECDGLTHKQLSSHALQTGYARAVFAIVDGDTDRAFAICQTIVYERTLGR